MLEDDFSEADDGRPKKAATGQRYRITDLGSNSGMTVKDGRLVHGVAEDGAGAGYLEAELSEDVQRIGAEAVFFPDSGSIALVSWDKPLADTHDPNTSAPHPRAGIHFVAGPDRWDFAVYTATGTGQEVLKSVEFAEPLTADGKTSHSFEITRKDDQVWVTGPNGTVTAIKDPRISDWAGPWACWELYEFSPDLTPAGFTKIWAG